MIEYGFTSQSIIKDEKQPNKSHLEQENEQLKQEIELLKSMIPNVA